MEAFGQFRRPLCDSVYFSVVQRWLSKANTNTIVGRTHQKIPRAVSSSSSRTMIMRVTHSAQTWKAAMLDMPRSGHWWPVFALPFEKQTTVSLTRCLFAKIVAYLDPLHWLKTVKDMRYSDSSGSALYAVAQQTEAMAGIELEFRWVPKDAEVMPHVLGDRLVAEQQMIGKVSNCLNSAKPWV